MYPKKILFFVSFLYVSLLPAQTAQYPKDYFQNPMDIPLILSGNFGELRDNHFHSGLDYKTQMKVGFPVFATADGYISRIKIEQYGYGKVLYVHHPNGYVTVYAHLQYFNPTIEQYAKQKQYEKENYKIDLYPKPTELPVKKGDIIAYSGDTGSSGGPHLHFEVRDADTQNPINPMLFGFSVQDTTKPNVQFLYAYPLSEDSVVNQSAVPVKINFSPKFDGHLYADPVVGMGKIGFAVNAYDQQNSDTNRNGIYSLTLKVNGEVYYKHQLDQFTFDESRLVNLHIDYEQYQQYNSRLQKCFIEPENDLSTYSKQYPQKGIVELVENERYQVEIEIGDFEGNSTKIFIPVVGKTDTIVFPKKELKTNFAVKHNEINTFALDSVSVIFPRNTFYADTNLQIQKLTNGNFQVHQDIIPLKRNFTVLFDVSKYPIAARKNLFVAKVSEKGKLLYVSSETKDNILIGKTRTLGTYTIAQDSKAPTIVPVNFKEGQWISQEKELQVKISDDFSGIKSFRGEINGKFIVMEWNHKTGMLTYNFADNIIKDTQHQFKLTVTDNANNTKIFNSTFYRANTP